MGQDFNIAPWKDSIFYYGTMMRRAPWTFLWHLRALLTGNDDPEFFGGSFLPPPHCGKAVPREGPPTLGDSAGFLYSGYSGSPTVSGWGLPLKNGVFSLFFGFSRGVIPVFHIQSLWRQFKTAQLTRPKPIPKPRGSQVIFGEPIYERKSR